MFRLDRAHKARAPRSLTKFRTRLFLEALESRIVPYSLSGDLWPHPALVTISFVPDGTVVGVNSSGPIYSNLFATMNATFGAPSVWENQILLAAQTWAQQTNINFELASDNGTPIGQGLYQQGDPGMGDVRIGGYNLGSGVLAQTYMPPPNSNYSLAGDMQFNTAAPWSIGGAAYDLYSVALHEFGHVVSLNEGNVYPSAMWQWYHGVLSGLTSDDIAGVQAAYGGPRAGDYFDNYAPNHTWQTSIDLTGYINPISKTVIISPMDIQNTSQTDWFVAQAPSGTTSTPMVLVQSWLQSMLRPQVQIYGNGYLLGNSSVGSPLGGSLLVVNLSGVTAGEMLYFAVSGENATPYGTGKYALSLNFGYGPTPSVGATPTATLDGVPLVTGNTEMNSVALAAPAGTAAPAAPAAVTLETAGLQASRVQPGSGSIVPPAATTLTASALTTSVIVAAPLAASFQAGNVLVVQPAPLLVVGTVDHAATDDLPAEPITATSVPAPVAVPAQPEQASRAWPAPAPSWSQASTAYFTADQVNQEETAASLAAGPSGVALEAAVAVAGFVAVTGERRLNPAETDEERKRQQRR